MNTTTNYADLTYTKYNNKGFQIDGALTYMAIFNNASDQHAGPTFNTHTHA